MYLKKRVNFNIYMEYYAEVRCLKFIKNTHGILNIRLFIYFIQSSGVNFTNEFDSY